MSHSGKSGSPDIRDTYSLLVLDVTFRTTVDDLFPLFEKYGKVVDVFIARDQSNGNSRGFAFVRNKYTDEAQKAGEKLDSRIVDGREIMVQFAKYGPNAEKIHKGRIVETTSKSSGRSRSRSPRPRYQDEYRDGDYRNRSRSRSRDRYDCDRYHEIERDNCRQSCGLGRSHSCSVIPDHHKYHGRGKYVRATDASLPHHCTKPKRSPSPRKTMGENPDGHNPNELSPALKSVLPDGQRSVSLSLSPRRSNAYD